MMSSPVGRFAAAIFIILVAPAQAAAPRAEVLKDIRTTGTSHDEGYFYPQEAVTVGSTTYFFANDGEHGLELWKTDGTAQGTLLVRDILPGPAGCQGAHLTVSGGAVYFTATDGVHGVELWRTLGTSETTHMVADLQWGPEGSYPSVLRSFNGGVSFVAIASLEGPCLFHSTGSNSTTRVLRSLHFADHLEILNMPAAVLGNTLLFGYYEANRGWELWKSDGTAAGTKLLKDINPGAAGSYAHEFTVAGTTMYFSAEDGRRGRELWKTNGTAAGTVLVKDLLPGTEGSYPEAMVAVGAHIYFLAQKNAKWSLWRSNGTAAGTVVVSDLTEGNGAIPQNKAAFQNSLYYGFHSSPYLYRIEPSGAVTTLATGAAPSVGLYDLRAGSTRLYFNLYSQSEGSELWGSDGTEAGTQPLAPLPGSESGYWGGLTVAGNKTYYLGHDPAAGTQIWTTNGPPQGTAPLGLPTRNPGSSLSAPKLIGDALYFAAHDGSSSGLWESDGTEVGTTLIKTAAPSSYYSFNPLGQLDGDLIFSGGDGPTTNALWKYSRSKSEVTRLGTIGNSFNYSQPFSGSQVGGHFYFQGYSNGPGHELWRTDGTPEGTGLFADITPNGSSYPRDFRVVHNQLYFIAGNRLHCLIGGTPTALTASGTNIRGSIAIGNVLYFLESSSASSSLRKTEGNGTATTLKTFMNHDVTNLVAVGSTLFFIASDGSQMRLWHSDGTSAGTALSPITQLTPHELSSSGEALYIKSYTSKYPDAHLLVSANGTAEPQAVFTGPFHFLNSAFGTQYFAVQLEGSLFAELWRTHGALPNTEKIAGALVDSNIQFIAGLGTRVFLKGWSPETGFEPFFVDVSASLNVEEISETGGLGKALNSGSTLAFGKEAVGETPPAQMIRIRNTGSFELTGLAVTIEGDDAAAFANATTVPATLAPGDWLDVEITFRPLAAGSQTAALRIISDNAADAFSLELAGTGVVPAKPESLRGPASQIALKGEPVQWTAYAIAEAPASYIWRRGAVIVGENATLSLAAVHSSDAGAYTVEVKNSLGGATTAPGFLAVVSPAPTAAAALAGQTLVLECNVSVPAGATATYRWLRNGAPMHDFGRVSGSRSPKLTVKNLRGSDTGLFDCEVSLNTASGVVRRGHGETAVTIMIKPTVIPMSLPDAIVGQSVNETFTAENFAATFTATGLPPGVVLNSKTGEISGRPTRAKMVGGIAAPYEIKVTAANASGRSASQTFYWTIHPLQIAGNWFGLVDRHSALNDGLGGAIRLTVSAAGGVSGYITLGTGRYALAGPLLVAPGGDVGRVTFTVRRRTGPDLTIHLELDHAPGLMTGSASLPDSDLASIEGTLSDAKRSVVPFAAGYYTAALQPGDSVLGDEEYPQGDGYLTFTVSAGAMATWVGKLADGTAVSGSSPFGIHGRLGIHALAYGNKGCIAGWSNVNGFAEGSFLWWKPPGSAGARSYQPGFLHPVTLTGGKYQKPFSGQVILGLPVAPPHNARLSFSAGGITTDLIQDFTITSRNTAQVPQNSEQIKFSSLNAATGLFAGSFTLTDADTRPGAAPGAEIKRTATFNGVLITPLQAGAGYFLLGQMPTEPGAAAVKATPILSGQVRMEARQ